MYSLPKYDHMTIIDEKSRAVKLPACGYPCFWPSADFLSVLNEYIERFASQHALRGRDVRFMPHLLSERSMLA